MDASQKEDAAHGFHFQAGHVLQVEKSQLFHGHLSDHH
jgi:hypothetical protein